MGVKACCGQGRMEKRERRAGEGEQRGETGKSRWETGKGVRDACKPDTRSEITDADTVQDGLGPRQASGHTQERRKKKQTNAQPARPKRGSGGGERGEECKQCLGWNSEPLSNEVTFGNCIRTSQNPTVVIIRQMLSIRRHLVDRLGSRHPGCLCLFALLLLPAQWQTHTFHFILFCLWSKHTSLLRPNTTSCPRAGPSAD